MPCTQDPRDEPVQRANRTVFQSNALRELPLFSLIEQLAQAPIVDVGHKHPTIGCAHDAGHLISVRLGYHVRVVHLELPVSTSRERPMGGRVALVERTGTRWILSMNTPSFGGTRAQEDIEYGCSSYRRDSILHECG